MLHFVFAVHLLLGHGICAGTWGHARIPLPHKLSHGFGIHQGQSCWDWKHPMPSSRCGNVNEIDAIVYDVSVPQPMMVVLYPMRVLQNQAPQQQWEE